MLQRNSDITGTLQMLQVLLATDQHDVRRHMALVGFVKDDHIVALQQGVCASLA